MQIADAKGDANLMMNPNLLPGLRLPATVNFGNHLQIMIYAFKNKQG